MKITRERVEELRPLTIESVLLQLGIEIEDHAEMPAGELMIDACRNVIFASYNDGAHVFAHVIKTGDEYAVRRGRGLVAAYNALLVICERMANRGDKPSLWYELRSDAAALLTKLKPRTEGR